MNRFIKVFSLGLLVATLLMGCSSARFTSTMKKQDYQSVEEVKFKIERVSIDHAGNRDKKRFMAALTKDLLMREAEKAYPELFATEGDAIPLELEISTESYVNNVIPMLKRIITLTLLPVTWSAKDDIKVNVRVMGERNAMLSRKSSEFRQELHYRESIYSPLGLITIPGKSDMPKVTLWDEARHGMQKSHDQLLRGSVVNAIVKNFKDSDMQKVTALHKRKQRIADAKMRISSRLLKGNSSKAMDKAAAKEPLVLMPLRASGVTAANSRAMEAAVASGLSERYKVYSGKRVADKVRQIYTKLTAETEAGKECDETMCMQDIGASFKTELVAIANVVKKRSGYLLTLNISNVFDDVVVMSESIPCKGCNEFQVIDRLKTISEI